MTKFNVLFLYPVIEFLDKIDKKASKKVTFNIDKAKILNDANIFKKLTNDIWEFRTFYNKTYYRLFAFWDKRDNKNTLVICTHGIIKKTQTIPKEEIKRAETLKKQYFDNN